MKEQTLRDWLDLLHDQHQALVDEEGRLSPGMGDDRRREIWAKRLAIEAQTERILERLQMGC